MESSGLRCPLPPLKGLALPIYWGKWQIFLLKRELLEFQTSSELAMVYRMQEYHAILRKVLGISVRQFVYFLGESPPSMRSQLSQEEIYTGFELWVFHHYHYQHFLNAQMPEEVMAALLADFGKEVKEKVVRKILERLLQLKGKPLLLRKYLRQMVILARLRKNLSETLQKQLKDMAITYNIEKDTLYQKGMEKRGVTESC